MRMLKKLLLAGAFIGVLGSFGFAQEAKAAKPAPVITVAGDKATIKYGDATTSANTIKVKVGDTVIDTLTIKPGESNTVSSDGIKAKVNAQIGSIHTTPIASITAVAVSSNGVQESDAGTGNMQYSLHRLAVDVNMAGAGKGSVTVTKDDGTTATAVYDYDQASGLGKPHTLTATGQRSGDSFKSWDDAVITNPRTNVYASASKSVYTATFDYTEPTPVGEAVALKITINNGTAVYSDEDPEATIGIKKGDTVTFGYRTPLPTGVKSSMLKLGRDNTSWTNYFSYNESTKVYTATKDTPSGEELGFWLITNYTEDEGGPVTSDNLYLTISGGTSTATRINLSDYKEYITEGYTLEFKAKASSDSVNLANLNTKLVISEGSDYVDSIEKTENTSDKNVTFKIKFKDEKQDKGTNSKDVKFKILVGGESGTACPIDSDSETQKKVTVYSNPTNSYNVSDRTMSYKVPAKVNTGTESGKDSNLSYTQDTVSDVKGIRINVLLNDNILGTTTTAASKGTSATVDASTMESIITNLGNSGKFTGDCTVVFRAYPSDGSGNCNKKVYHDTYAKVYKVVLRPGQSATAGAKTASAYALPIAMIAQRNTGATTTTATTTAAGKEYVLYGLEGQTLTVPAGVTDIVDANGNAVTKIVVSADANKNVYTYAATASATKEGLDKVPKTGQNNVFVYVMAVVVCGAVGYGLYVYNKKSKKSI